MMCTANWKMLQKYPEFEWSVPATSKGKDFYIKHNLQIVWDLILKEWRMVNLNDVDIISVYPITSVDDEEYFVEYYKNLMKRRGKNSLIGNFNN